MTFVAVPARAPARQARALRAPVVIAVAAMAVAAVVAVVDPNEPGHYPTCPFLALTGHWCPGCGSLRALHALAHGDLSAAVGLNALTVAAVPLLVVVWARWASRARGGRARTSLAHPAWTWALLAVVLGFWLLRNLPIGAALAP